MKLLSQPSRSSSMRRSQVIDHGLFACESYPAFLRGVAGDNSTWTEGTRIFVGGGVEAFQFVDMVFSDGSQSYACRPTGSSVGRHESADQVHPLSDDSRLEVCLSSSLRRKRVCNDLCSCYTWDTNNFSVVVVRVQKKTRTCSFRHWKISTQVPVVCDDVQGLLVSAVVISERVIEVVRSEW